MNIPQDASRKTLTRRAFADFLAEAPDPSDLCRFLARRNAGQGVLLIRSGSAAGAGDCAYSPGLLPLTDALCADDAGPDFCRALQAAQRAGQEGAKPTRLSRIAAPAVQRVIQSVFRRYGLADATLVFITTGPTCIALLFPVAGTAPDTLPFYQGDMAEFAETLTQWVAELHGADFDSLERNAHQLAMLEMQLVSLGRDGALYRHNGVLDGACLRLGVSDADILAALGSAGRDGEARRLAIRDGRQIVFLPRPLPAHLDHPVSPVRAIGVLSERAAPPDPVARFAGEAGLTPSETRIVRALCEGLDVAAAAARHRIAASTARQQLKSVYRKSNCKTQSQVVASVFANYLE